MIIKDKDFVKSLIFWIAILLIFLAGSEMLISCKAKKPLVESTKSEVVKSDFTAVNKTTEISQPIRDTVFVPVGNIETGNNDCDKKCNDALRKQLEGLNTKKKSGKNEAGFYYDQFKKMLVAYSSLDASYSVFKDSISKSSISDKKESVKPVLVPAEFSKEQTFNLCVGRLFWVFLIVATILWLRKKFA